MPSSTKYYECRHLGHSWDQIPSTERPPWGVYLWLRCTRCTMLRKDIINQFTGELMSRKYDQPIGYRMSKDERPSIEELRKHQLNLGRRRAKKQSA